MHDTHAISDQAQPKPQSHIGMVGPPQPPHSIQTRHDSKQPAAAASGPAKPTQSCQPPPCNHSTPCAAAAPHWRGRPTTCCCCLPCPTQHCQPPTLQPHYPLCSRRATLAWQSYHSPHRSPAKLKPGTLAAAAASGTAQSQPQRHIGMVGPPQAPQVSCK